MDIITALEHLVGGAVGVDARVENREGRAL